SAASAASRIATPCSAVRPRPRSKRSSTRAVSRADRSVRPRSPVVRPSWDQRASGPCAQTGPKWVQGVPKENCMSSVRSFRRGVLIAAAALFATSLATSASAQMELKIIAPAAPGGGWDQTARSMQQALVAEKLVKSAQVINIAGAGGTVGLAQFVNGAKGDGNQLMVNGFVMVGAILMNKSPVSMSQITPIARITEETQVMVVPANSPIKTAKDLAEAVKKDVAKVTFAGGSAGGVDHIMAALLVGAVGADASKVNYVPFSGGGESLAAILGGKVTAGISGVSEYEGQIKAGKLRAIGVTSPDRLAGFDIPTFKEQG